jgi:hypothetical protein
VLSSCNFFYLRLHTDILNFLKKECSVHSMWEETQVVHSMGEAEGPFVVISPNRSRSRRYFKTDGRSVSMSWCQAYSETCDQILLLVGMLLSESCGLVSVGRPIWRENGSAICSAITQWFESHRTLNHTLLSVGPRCKPSHGRHRKHLPTVLLLLYDTAVGKNHLEDTIPNSYSTVACYITFT